MGVSTFKQKQIEMLIAEDGEDCRYCRKRVRKNFVGHDYADNDATIDHIIPRSKGGTNDRKNLCLACRRCNNAKGDRDLADFLADPRSFSERKKSPRRKARNVRFVAVPAEAKEKFIRGTMAWAIQQGDVLPHGVYRRVRPNDVPGVRIPAPRMTALETARWLREQAEKKGKKWPLA